MAISSKKGISLRLNLLSLLTAALVGLWWIAPRALAAPQTTGQGGQTASPASQPINVQSPSQTTIPTTGGAPEPRKNFYSGTFPSVTYPDLTKPLLPPAKQFSELVKTLKSGRQLDVDSTRSKLDNYFPDYVATYPFMESQQSELPAPVEEIKAALRSEDPYIQRCGLIAVELLRVDKSKRAEMMLPVLEQSLPDGDAAKRAATLRNRGLAANLIGNSPGSDRRPEVVAALGRAMESGDSDDLVRFYAAQSLIQVEALPDTEPTFLTAQTRDDARVVFAKALARILSETKIINSKYRWGAITVLGTVKTIDEKVVKEIENGMKDPLWVIRDAAVQALGKAATKLRDKEVVGVAVRGLTELIELDAAQTGVQYWEQGYYPNWMYASGILAQLSDLQRNQREVVNLNAFEAAAAKIQVLMKMYQKQYDDCDDGARASHAYYGYLTNSRNMILANTEAMRRQLWVDRIVRSWQFWAVLSSLVLIAAASAFIYKRPLTLLAIRQVFRESLFARLVELVTNGKLKLGDVTMPRVFGAIVYQPRVLDAWVARHLDSARDQFAALPTVEKRRNHIPCSVMLDRNEVPALTPEKLRATFGDRKRCLLITGEGGAGKTSLACLVAGWAIAADRDQRIAAHPMLPILLDRDLDQAEGDSPFLEAIRQRLRGLIGLESVPDDELVVNLLRRGRLLVIVDHLSEMSEATRALIRPGHADFPASALVVTSRIEESLEGVARTVLRPMRLRKNRLGSFVEAYLKGSGNREQFNDTEFFGVLSGLATMVGDRDVTALLAILYADQAVSEKNQAVTGALAGNIPDLFLNYLRELASSARDDDDEVRRVLCDAKAVAWECLKASFRPAAIGRNHAISAIKDADLQKRKRDYEEKRPASERRRGDASAPESVIQPISDEVAEVRLRQLEGHLGIIETVRPDGEVLRMVLDPLAEYLAGLAVVEKNGNNQLAWRNFVKRLDDLQCDFAAVQGFLLAVRDCARARATELTLPEWVRIRLDPVTTERPSASLINAEQHAA
jgi:hypothetical protein